MEVISEEPQAPSRPWNHNVAYHGVVRRAVPSGSRDLLDVGCGRGRLARRLALADPRRHVLGLARAVTLPEALASAACAPVVWFNDLRPDFGEASAVPIVEPLLGWHATAELARAALPQAHFRRRLYYRYSLRLTKPHG